jgi:hypothetical protein
VNNVFIIDNTIISSDTNMRKVDTKQILRPFLQTTQSNVILQANPVLPEIIGKKNLILHEGIYN